MDVPSALDFELIAYNVRCMRMAHSQTQADLAKLAGVDKTTIHRLETGAKVRPRTLVKICAVLGEPVSFLNSVLPYGTPQHPRATFVHRNAALNWFAMGDRRKRIPEDNQTRIQREEERLRLGRQGLVTSFQAYTFAMPNGPGMSISEIYGQSVIGPNETYEDCVVHCARGELLFRSTRETIHLLEGDGIGFSAEEAATIEPAQAIGPNDYPPLMWFITANRKGHVPIAFRGTQRRRTRRSGSKLLR